MAGFRIGRGRDTRNAQQHGQYPPQQAPGPYGQPPQGPPPYGSSAYGQRPQGQRHGQPWQPGASHNDEPEYFGDPRHAQHGGPGGHPGYGTHGGPAGRPGPGHDPRANNPGHTQAFSLGDGPDPGYDPYAADDGYGAGGPPPPPPGPRLHWKQLLSGIVLRPNATFWQMRDHNVWGPALIVTFVYGLLAVFGFDQAREEVFDSTLASAIPYVLTTGLAIVIAGLILGTVTHTLARQFGGNGTWGPTIGLSMLIMSITDAPRVVFAMFLGGDASLVQVVGWLSWIAAGALLTSMVSRSHDLPWAKALGASSIQLIALLTLLKLGTL